MDHFGCTVLCPLCRPQVLPYNRPRRAARTALGREGIFFSCSRRRHRLGRVVWPGAGIARTTPLSKLDEYIPALRRYAWTMLRNAGEADGTGAGDWRRSRLDGARAETAKWHCCGWDRSVGGNI